MGATGAFLIALSRGALTFSGTMQVLIETVQTAATLFTVLIGAWIFSNFVNLAGLPEALSDFVLSRGVSPTLVILMILLVYLALGCVFESLSMLLLTVPIFFPVVTALGFDPVWFGILLMVLLETALITPPIGINLYVVQSIRKGGPIMDVIKGALPFVVTMFIMLTILLAFPGLALWLPSLVY